MPFTPAHVLMPLPFIRKLNPLYFSATALIIGSMAPDFEYFIEMNDDQHYGHTWAGSVFFDIHVTIAMAFLFHLVIKKNLINNLPHFLQSRLQPLLHFDFTRYFLKHWAVFIISAWIGTMSHFMLDSFTHQDGFFFNLFFYPEAKLIVFGSVQPAFYVIQLMFSVIGCIAIIFYVINLPAVKSPYLNLRPRLSYWITFGIVSFLIITLHYTLSGIQVMIPNFVISSITASLAGLIICGLLTFDNRTWGAR